MPTQWSESILVADLAGEPDFSEELSAVYERVAAAPMGELHAEVSHAPPPHGTHGLNVVLNLASVDYINSSNIASLLRMRRTVGEHGGVLVLAGVNDEIKSVLALTGVGRLFTFAPDTMTALAHVQLTDEARGHAGV